MNNDHRNTPQNRQFSQNRKPGSPRPAKKPASPDRQYSYPPAPESAPGPTTGGAKTPVSPTAAKPRSKAKTVAAVWLSVLSCFLIFALIISLSGRKETDKPDSTDAPSATHGSAGENGATDAVDAPPEISYPVSYAVYDERSTTFPSALTFDNGILINLKSNTVIASRKGDERIYPASMTKIMTLIVAYESITDFDDTFTMVAEITDPLYLENASVAGFSIGEEINMKDLIYGLILPSGGDAAMGLAYHIAGSEEAFAELMNQKAAELGLKNTHFTNCTGLHNANHYSTCHEIALILEYAIQNDFMRTVLSTYQYTTAKTPEHPDGIELTSTLFSRMYGDESGTAFVIGGKTGYTTEAKNCLATFATNFADGEPEADIYSRSPDYILVTAGSTDKWGPVFDAIDVYKEFATGYTAASAGTGGADQTNVAGGAGNDGGSSGNHTGGEIIYTAADPAA